jgi:hypothetical protein
MFFVAGPQQKVEKALRAVVEDIIAKASDDLQGIRSLHDLHVAEGKLRSEIETLKIEKGRREEEFNRKEREVEHKVGLERKRQEFELSSGKREATLSVREENLAADRKRFEEQMKFHEDRFTAEVGYLKDLLGQIMERLPSTEIALTGNVGGKRGHNRG